MSGRQDWNPDTEYPARLSGDELSATATGTGAAVRSLAGTLFGAAMVVVGEAATGVTLTRRFHNRRGRRFRLGGSMWLIPLCVGPVFAVAAAVLWFVGRTYR